MSRDVVFKGPVTFAGARKVRLLMNALVSSVHRILIIIQFVVSFRLYDDILNFIE